jgi:hypothetical protein
MVGGWFWMTFFSWSGRFFFSLLFLVLWKRRGEELGLLQVFFS